MLSFKITSTLRFLAVCFLLLQFGKVNAQCETCSTTITSNSPSSYTVSAGQTVCVAKGFDFTGTITLNGGTLCNSGTVHSINFNSGIFDNYGLYSRLTGTIALNNTAPLTINNYNTIELNNLDFGNGSNVTLNTYSKMVVNGWLDVHRDSEEDLITMNVFNSLDEKSTANLNVFKDFTLTKGRLTMNVSNNSKVCAKVECTGFVNVGGQFTVNNSSLILIVNPNGIFNVKKAVSLDGKKNKEINNAGTINFASDFNVGGNGQNTGLVSINNMYRSTFNINGNVNLNYNNGTINFINHQEGFLNVGKSFNISKQNNNFTNNGKMLIARDLILDNGLFTNNSGINIRTVEIKNGTLTNNSGLYISRDLFTTNNSGVINNNGIIEVGRDFINTSTVNLGKKSVITTLNYENEGNSVINGPVNINDGNGNPDSTNYASVIISGNSKNSGYINNYVLIYDKTRPPNSTVGFDNFANANRVGPGVVIITPGNPITHCKLTVFYSLNALASPNQVCSGNQISLSANTIYSTPAQPNSVSYSWNTSPITNSANATVNPVNSTNGQITTGYTVTATYVLPGRTCVKTKAVNITVNPNPTITITGTSTICFGQTTTLTANGADNYVWNGANNSNPFVTPVLANTTSYTVAGTNLYNCVSTSTISVTVKANPIVNAGVDQSVPAGTTVNLSASANSGTLPYTFQWTPSGNGMTPANGSVINPTVIPSQTVTYTVVVTDANSCSAADEVTITITSFMQFAILKKEINGGFFEPSDNKLNFKFDGEYINGNNLNYTVYDRNHSVILTSQTALKNVTTNANNWKYGDNRFELDIASIPTGQYLLEVNNEKKEKFYLRFKK